MFVSSGGVVVMRADYRCKIKRNGSFLDIWIDDGGRTRHISILENDIREFINSNSEEGEILVGFDVAADDATLMKWLIQQKEHLEKIRHL